MTVLRTDAARVAATGCVAPMRWWLAVLLVLTAWSAGAACPPSGAQRGALFALKAPNFAPAQSVGKPELAVTLIDCLADPDPALRDAVAYEALAHWMRAGDFNAAQLRTFRNRLYGLLDGEEGDGYARPFAALVLSEVARTDRIAPWMSPAERGAMIDKAAIYEEAVHDYRGYDPGQGWRHAVAHGADWLMQLAMNPKLQRAQADRILAAVASQAVPASGHAYIFGESQRLLAPVMFVAQHGFHTPQEWQAWFNGLTSRLGEQALAYKDVAWLGRRHDLNVFLQAAYVEADHSRDPAIRELKPAVTAALKAMP